MSARGHTLDSPQAHRILALDNIVIYGEGPGQCRGRYRTVDCSFTSELAHIKWQPPFFLAVAWVSAMGRMILRDLLWLPSCDFEDAAEADSVEGFGATALAAEAGELDEHLGGAGGIAVAELDNVVAPSFEARAPVGRAGAVLGFLGTGGDGSKELPVQIEVEDCGVLFHIGR